MPPQFSFSLSYLNQQKNYIFKKLHIQGGQLYIAPPPLFGLLSHSAEKSFLRRDLASYTQGGQLHMLPLFGFNLVTLVNRKTILL